MKIINLIRYLLEFVIIITFFFLFKILGLKLSSFISGKIFTFLGPLFRSKKMFAKNFKIAFPNTPESTTKKYFNEMWNYYGRIFAEYPFLFKFRKDEIKILYPDVKLAKKIIVIDSGKIIEKGNHKSLLASKGVYHNLYQQQLESEKYN